MTEAYLVSVDSLELKEIPDFRVKMVFPEHLALLDRKVTEASLEDQVLTVLKDVMEKVDCQGLLASLAVKATEVILVLLVHQASKETLAYLAEKVSRELPDQLDHQALLVCAALLVFQGPPYLALKVTLEHPVGLDSVDYPARREIEVCLELMAFPASVEMTALVCRDYLASKVTKACLDSQVNPETWVNLASLVFLVSEV